MPNRSSTWSVRRGFWWAAPCSRGPETAQDRIDDFIGCYGDEERTDIGPTWAAVPAIIAECRRARASEAAMRAEPRPAPHPALLTPERVAEIRARLKALDDPMLTNAAAIDFGGVAAGTRIRVEIRRVHLQYFVHNWR